MRRRTPPADAWIPCNLGKIRGIESRVAAIDNDRASIVAQVHAARTSKLHAACSPERRPIPWAFIVRAGYISHVQVDDPNVDPRPAM